MTPKIEGSPQIFQARVFNTILPMILTQKDNVTKGIYTRMHAYHPNVQVINTNVPVYNVCKIIFFWISTPNFFFFCGAKMQLIIQY